MEDILLGNDWEHRLKNLEKRRIFKQLAVIKVFFAPGYFQGFPPNSSQRVYYSAQTRRVTPRSQLGFCEIYMYITA